MSVYPEGGYQLLKLRRAGKRPADPVVVRFSSKPIHLPNPVLTFEQGVDPAELDLTMLHDLDVLLIARKNVPNTTWTRALISLVRAEPRFLGVYDPDQKAGHTIVAEGEVAISDWDEQENRSFFEEFIECPALTS